jgi:hypothetical protein
MPTIPTDVERQLSATLRAHADDPLPVRPAAVAALAARHRVRRRQLAGGVSLAAVTAAAAVALVLGATSTLGGASAPAAGPTTVPHRTLDARGLLLVASQQAASAAPMAKGNVWYTREQDYTRPPTAAERKKMVHKKGEALNFGRRTIEYWLSRDGRYRSLISKDGVTVHGDDADGNGKRPVSFGIGYGTLGWAQLEHLPAGKGALKTVIVRLAGGPSTERLFLAITDLLNTPASPAVKATAYKLLADVPGMRAMGAVRDPLGRPGQGVAWRDADGTSWETIFDDHGRLLAYQARVRGQVVQSSAYQAATFVGRIGQR